MKVKDLKELLGRIPDGMSLEEWNNAPVLIPVGEIFDGYWIEPCMEDSGHSQLGMGENESLGQVFGEQDAFCIVRCGFFSEEEHNHQLN